jgi:hypothetical protein
MKDSRRAKNCERCNLRKSQEKWFGKIFDYKNCPFVCLQNKIDHRGLVLNRKGV